MSEKHHLIYKIYREKTIKRVDHKIKLLGVNCKYNVIDLLNYRLLTSLAIFALIIVLSKHGYFLAPLITLLFYLGSEYVVLDLAIKKRAKKLEDEAVFFFEVLNLSLESGRNIKAALDMTTNNINSELSLEFKKTLSEIKLGKSLTESLNSMKERIPSDAINNIILSLSQSSIFGNSITDTLNNQLDFLREKKLLDVKAEITKLPTKISVISVIFFIPLILLLILAPVLIEFLS